MSMFTILSDNNQLSRNSIKFLFQEYDNQFVERGLNDPV